MLTSIIFTLIQKNRIRYIQLQMAAYTVQMILEVPFTRAMAVTLRHSFMQHSQILIRILSSALVDYRITVLHFIRVQLPGTRHFPGTGSAVL
jgi:hypothetical protein